MTSAAGNIGLAAEVQVIACSASRSLTAGERRRARQGRVNAGAGGARPDSFVVLYRIPEEVIAHFRNLRTIGSLGSKVRVTVFDPVFQDRAAHQQAVLALLPAFGQERCIVFLDPDTGVEPRTPRLDHVLASEARAIWDAMKPGDAFAFYQHQTNRAGQPWIEPKRGQLADALAVPIESVKIASGPGIAQDVVFFYTPRA